MIKIAEIAALSLVARYHTVLMIWMSPCQFWQNIALFGIIGNICQTRLCDTMVDC